MYVRNGQRIAYPAIVVFMQKSDQLTRLKAQFIVHGRVKIQLDAVDVAGWRIMCHISGGHRAYAVLGACRRDRTIWRYVERVRFLIAVFPRSANIAQRRRTCGAGSLWCRGPDSKRCRSLHWGGQGSTSRFVMSFSKIFERVRRLIGINGKSCSMRNFCVGTEWICWTVGLGWASGFF